MEKQQQETKSRTKLSKMVKVEEILSFADFVQNPACSCVLSQIPTKLLVLTHYAYFYQTKYPALYLKPFKLSDQWTLV